MAQHYKFPESTEQFKTKALYTIRKAILNLSLQQTEDFTCFYTSILLNMKVVITDKIWIAGISNDTLYRDWETDRKSTRLNSSHSGESRMPSSA